MRKGGRKGLFSVAVPIGGGSLKQTEISFETGEKGFKPMGLPLEGGIISRRQVQLIIRERWTETLYLKYFSNACNVVSGCGGQPGI